MVLKSDRPLKRSIVKLGSSLLFGRAWAHAQNWLPGLQLQVPLTAGSTGKIIYKSEDVGQLHHADLLRWQAPNALQIIGSGPSVAGVNFARIPSEGAMLLNGSISLVGSQVSKPLVVVIEDERFVWRHFDLMQEKIAAGWICLFSVGVIRAICEKDRAWLADKKTILIDDIRKPYRAKRRSNEEVQSYEFVVLDEAGVGFSSLPSFGVFQGGSVVVSAMQFAVHCQPSNIDLVGIDISNARSPRFYEKADKMAASGIALAADRIVAHLALARHVCMKRNIEIRNHSPVSALIGAGFGYDPQFAKTHAS